MVDRGLVRSWWLGRKEDGLCSLAVPKRVLMSLEMMLYAENWGKRAALGCMASSTGVVRMPPTGALRMQLAV